MDPFSLCCSDDNKTIKHSRGLLEGDPPWTETLLEGDPQKEHGTRHRDPSSQKKHGTR